METRKPPSRIIAPGRVFRSDEVDATHSPSFHQIEGLVIDKNIALSDLKGTLAEFAKELFGEETKVKFRPHHVQMCIRDSIMGPDPYACELFRGGWVQKIVETVKKAKPQARCAGMGTGA